MNRTHTAARRVPNTSNDRFDYFNPIAGVNPGDDRGHVPGTRIWQAVRNIPVVRDWQVARDAVFHLTSFPVGVAAFVVAVTGGATGFALAWLLIGFPILVWTIGLLLRGADIERARINILLDANLHTPDYGLSAPDNVFKHLLRILGNGPIWRNSIYMLLMFPIGIMELVLLFLPLEFLSAGLGYLGFGSISPFEAFGMDINSFIPAVASVGFGLLLIIPVMIAMRIVTRMHLVFARHMIGSK